MRGAPRLKSVVRRLGGRRLTELRRSRHTPEVSVVMPVYNVAEYLPTALDSVLSQSLTSLEVVAVDDGSTDRCLEILRDYERRDYRVRVLTQPNAGQGVARNHGVDAARGEFLTFMDSDDTLPTDAYASMVEGLRRSGSDFSVGNLRRLRHGRLTPLIWSRTVHRQDRIGTTIEEFPNAMQDIIACNRMFRTAFWREQVGAFEGGIAYEDHVPMLTAYVRARTFDVLQKVTYHWRIREDLTSTGQQKARIANLRDRIAVKEQAHELLVAEASEAVYAAWVGRTLEVDFPPFLPHALAGDADYRALLAETYRTFLARATPRPSRWSGSRCACAPTSPRRSGGRTCSLPTTTCARCRTRHRRASSTGSWSRTSLPSAPGSDALPADLRWMAPLESHFEGAVEHLEWTDEGLRITGWAWLRGLDMQGPAGGTTVQAWLVDSATRADRIPLTVEQRRLPEADEWGPLANASPAGGGFVATADLTSLTPGSWFVEVQVEQEGLVAAGELHGRVARSAAVRASTGVVHGLGITADWDAGTGLTLHVTPGVAVDPRGELVEIEDAELDGDNLVLTVRDSGERVGDVALVPSDPVGRRGGSSTPTGRPGADGRPHPPHLRPHGDRPRRQRSDPPPKVPTCSVPTPVVRTTRHPPRAWPDGLRSGCSRPTTASRWDSARTGAPWSCWHHRCCPTSWARSTSTGSRNEPAAPRPSPPGHCSSGPGPDQDAIDAWLAQHRPDLARERGEALVRGSQGWYAALAAAPFVSLQEDLGAVVREAARANDGCAR